MTTATPTTYYKLDVQGIVYLVNPTNSTAYTYDIESPTEIGRVVWSDPAKVPRMELLPTWKEIMATKRTENVIGATAPALSH
jgi:hypothetical protein